MQFNEHNDMSDPSDLTQLPLWSDDELSEAQQPAQDEDQDVQEASSFPAHGRALATQLYLPGFELE